MNAAGFLRHSCSSIVYPANRIKSPVTSPRQQPVVSAATDRKFTREFHGNGCLQKYETDLLIGQHPPLKDLSVVLRHASTVSLKVPLSRNSDSLREYMHASGGKKGERSAVEELGRLKGKNGEPDMTWEDIADPESLYEKTARRLFENTKGKISLTTAGVDMRWHFLGRMKVIQEFGSLERFFQTVKKGDLDYETGMSITGYELSYLVEGPGQAYREKLELLHPTKKDDSGKPEILGKREFLKLYNDAVAATNSPPNLKLFSEIGLFTAEAEAAIAKLQEFVHGHPNRLYEPDPYRN